MKYEGDVDVAVKIKREVETDGGLDEAKKLLESDVYGALHGIKGVKGILIEHISVMG